MLLLAAGLFFGIVMWLTGYNDVYDLFFLDYGISSWWWGRGEMSGDTSSYWAVFCSLVFLTKEKQKSLPCNVVL
jgi:hypothetical protein